MELRAVAFDIGGVLEITPSTGWIEWWEGRLGLEPGELWGQRLGHVSRAGNLGQLDEQQVERQVGELLGLGPAQRAAFMADLWNEYLGTLNVELARYFASLRPRYQTAIISNSFAGARRQEQLRYQFDQLCDLIVYSHEEGLEKPDPRIYQLTCQRLGVRPEQMIFLDDVAGHVAAARALGIHGILFEHNAQAITAIERARGRA